MMPYNRTATGSMWRATAVVGSRLWLWATEIGAPTVTVAIGFILDADGSGFRIIPGDGPLSIMDAGFNMRHSDGAGHRTWFGGLRGFAGDFQPTIAAGLRSRRRHTISQARAL